MRIDKNSNTQNFTSVLPTVVKVNGALSKDSEFTQKVMQNFSDDILLQNNIYSAVKTNIKKKFIQFIPHFKVFSKHIINVEKPELTRERPYLGYLFTDETALKVKLLKTNNSNIEDEILHNKAYRAMIEQTPIGLTIETKTGNGKKFEINDISFYKIEESKFKPETCLIA